jgi:hypothetical protein
MHQEVAAFRGADQATDRGLPFLEILLGFGQLHDAGGGILERDELATKEMPERPHEEGVDCPEGEACPDCPFWAGRGRPIGA